MTKEKFYKLQQAFLTIEELRRILQVIERPEFFDDPPRLNYIESFKRIQITRDEWRPIAEKKVEALRAELSALELRFSKQK